MKFAFTNKQLGRSGTYVQNRDPFWSKYGGPLRQRVADRMVAVRVAATYDEQRSAARQNRRKDDPVTAAWVEDALSDGPTEFRSGQWSWWNWERAQRTRREAERTEQMRYVDPYEYDSDWMK